MTPGRTVLAISGLVLVIVAVGLLYIKGMAP
jgi:hypothetical protein